MSSNIITFKAGKLPGLIKEFAIAANSTIQQALALAELEVGSHEVRVNGGIATLDQIVENGDIIILVEKIAAA